MSNATVATREANRRDTAKNANSAIATFEFPKFETPKFEMPAAIRDLLQETGAEAKDSYEKMKTATDQVNGAFEASYSSALKGATDYGLKVIAITRANATAAFDLLDKLVAVNSPSEAVELSTAHACRQFDAISTQSNELWALSQKIATDMAKPIKTGMSKAFQVNA